MKAFFVTGCFTLLVFGSQVLAQSTTTVNVDNRTPEERTEDRACTPIRDAKKRYDETYPKTGLGRNKPADANKLAQKCLEEDRDPDPTDEGVLCEEIVSECKILNASELPDAKDQKEVSEESFEKAEKALKEERELEGKLSEEGTEIAENYAEKETAILEEIQEQTERYEAEKGEADAAALEQVQKIQQTLQEIKVRNENIIKQANRAQGQRQTTKDAVTSECNKQAMAIYAAKLTYLKEISKDKKVAGGFEGIQNYERYYNFLISKSRHAIPSEEFTLCFSKGGATDSSLRALEIGTALTMDELAKEIESNNSQRDLLMQQLQQRVELEDKTKTAAYNRHFAKLQALQTKLQKNDALRRSANGVLDKKRQENAKELQKLIKRVDKLKQEKENAEQRYACLKNGSAGFSGKSDVDGSEIINNFISAYKTLENECSIGNVPSACSAACRGISETPSATSSRSSSPATPAGVSQ